MEIKILGSSCKKCLALSSNVELAARNLGIDDITIEKVTDIVDIANFGVMSTPGLVINGKVVSTGKVASEKEIEKLLTSAA